MAEVYVLLSDVHQIDASEAFDIHYSIIEAVVEFMTEYTSPESERYTSALRTSFGLIEMICQRQQEGIHR